MKLTGTNKKIAIGVGIGVLAFIGYKLAFPKVSSGNSQIDPTGNGSVTPVSGNPASGTASFDAAGIADKLWKAMRDTGTDETAIKNALKYVNEAQFQQVIQAFGQRDYIPLFGNDGWGSTPHPLIDWLQSELSDSDYNVLRLKYPNTL